MVASVINLNAKINYLAASKKTSGCGLLDALVNCGNVLPGYYAAYYRIFKNIAGTAWHAFHFNPAIAKLATAARLLLVPALHLANAAHGFTIRHFWRFQDYINFKAAPGFFHSKFNMQLAHARKQNIAVFLVSPQL